MMKLLEETSLERTYSSGMMEQVCEEASRKKHVHNAAMMELLEKETRRKIMYRVLP